MKNIRRQIVPSAPWFDEEYKTSRKLRRKAEKRYKASGSDQHKQEFINSRKDTTVMAFNKKRAYFSGKIEECNGNSKPLFSCLNSLLDKKQDTVLPTHDSPKQLAERFQTHFKDKITKIRHSFKTINTQKPRYIPNLSQTQLHTLQPTTEDEINSIIMSYGINSSPEDSIPTTLLTNNLDLFIPIWTNIVNLSLAQGTMECLKSAVLIPLIKELDDLIDTDILNNYRPVSNLVFISKLIERVVAIRLENHMRENNLNINKQYSYKKGHSTEMLLVKVVNDLLIACDKKSATLLILLDLSAAFNTVDQHKMLQILQNEIGIQGIALCWFKSFLCSRTQKVKIENLYSSTETLLYGVPQGSVLGPVLFNIYIRSLYQPVQSLGFDIEGFADDHQLRLQLNPIFQIRSLGHKIQQCFDVITNWMNQYFHLVVE